MRFLSLLLLLSPSAFGQDAGVVDCAPRCAGNVLHYCDAGAPVSRDCAALLATCGELSPSWGADCLLPEGAACEAGYAEGLSQCAGASAASHCCIDGVCTSTTVTDCTEFLPDPLPTPTRPTDGPTGTRLDDLGGCNNCQDASIAGFFGLFLLRLRRRRW